MSRFFMVHCIYTSLFTQSVATTTGRQIRTIQTATKTFLFVSSLNETHCDWLIICVLAIHFTYLLVYEKQTQQSGVKLLLPLLHLTLRVAACFTK